MTSPVFDEASLDETDSRFEKEKYFNKLRIKK